MHQIVRLKFTNLQITGNWAQVQRKSNSDKKPRINKVSIYKDKMAYCSLAQTTVATFIIIKEHPVQCFCSLMHF